MTIRRRIVTLGLVVALAVSGWGLIQALFPPSPASPVAPAMAAESRPPAATPQATRTATLEPESTPEPGYQRLEDVELGQCFNSVKDADDDTTLAASIIDCAQPHDSELIALPLLEGTPDAPFPGDHEVESLTLDLCDAAFEDYVGIPYDDSVYEYAYYTPTEGNWLARDREVLCIIEHSGERVAGSVRGTNR